METESFSQGARTAQSEIPLNGQEPNSQATGIDPVGTGFYPLAQGVHTSAIRVRQIGAPSLDLI
jgi:hypothetical protein